MDLVVFTPDPLERNLIARALRQAFRTKVAEASSPADALERAGSAGLLVIREPSREGDRLTFVPRALEARPGLRILILEGQAPLGPLPYLETGAVGYVPGGSIEDLLDHVRAARSGAAILSPWRTNAEIAAALGVAVGTVKSQVHSILAKLDVDDRRQAGRYWRSYRRGADETT
ncbi:MAG TPA: LuxR C-terminal-related transcriptional regulator [Gemmatimonadota bacterium]|nr:LuxR C-terminal-related transcriptional regulator [Gemmatimonadota bacterium]